MRKQPVVGVGAVIIYQNRVLLVKRAKLPYEGLWTIPGGKVNWGETLQQAAEREVLEETGVIVKAKNPIFAFDLINTESSDVGKAQVEISYHYIVIDLEAEYLSGEPRAESDARDAAWFECSDIPNNKLIQETTRILLSDWCK